MDGITRIGILGGGQLAAMTAEAARKLGFATLVLDPDPDCAAARDADGLIQGRLDDPDALTRLVSAVDITTYDREDVDCDALEALERDGERFAPSPAIVRLTQDKLVQRLWLRSIGAPVPDFQGMDEPSTEALLSFGLPAVQKARRGGYDGRGVLLVRDHADVEDMLPVPSIVERLVPIAKELSVIVARDAQGELATYDPVEAMANQGTLALDLLVAPALVDERVRREAIEIAEHVVRSLEGVGIFAVEMMLSKEGELFVNEIAARPHNTGHVTNSAAVTSQFEQHVRTIVGLPLGSTRFLGPAAMVNIMAAGQGPARVEGLGEALSQPGSRVHIYGKRMARPGRKMGHATVVDSCHERALAGVLRIREKLRVLGALSA